MPEADTNSLGSRVKRQGAHVAEDPTVGLVTQIHLNRFKDTLVHRSTLYPCNKWRD